MKQFYKKLNLLVFLLLASTLSFAQTFVVLKKNNIMNKYNCIVLIFTFCFLSKSFSQNLVPIIKDFNPKNGLSNSEIIIHGKNFSLNNTNNHVYLGGIKANVIFSNDSIIKILAPQGFSYSKIKLIINNLIAESNFGFNITNNSKCKLENNFSKPINSKLNSPNIEFFDFNNDSIIDFCSVADSLIISLGNGDGTFKEFKKYPLDENSYFTSLCDLNSDNNIDIIISYVDNTKNYISVKLGNGDGTFKEKYNINLNYSPRYIKCGDVNMDGKIDLVINSGSSTFYHLGNGDGTIQNTSFLNKDLATSANSIEIIDIDKNGFNDIITVGSSGIMVFKFLNGIVQYPDFYSLVNSNMNDVKVADINKDNYLDIVVANNGLKTIGVFLGTPTGDFSPAKEFNTNTKSTLTKLDLIDINGDNNLDIITANYFDNSFSSLIGYGDGTFKEGKINKVNNLVYGIKSGDFNHDGNQDVAVFGNEFFIFLNNERPQYSFSFTDSITKNEATDLVFQFNGKAPWSLVLNDEKKDTLLENIQSNPFILTLTPLKTTEYSIKNFTDSLACNSYTDLKSIFKIYVTDTIISGIFNNYNINKFEIFPNPAFDNITISFDESISGIVSIIDSKGNVVLTKAINGNSSNISTNEFASGVYIVKISTEKGVSVKQLVVR